VAPPRQQTWRPDCNWAARLGTGAFAAKFDSCMRRALVAPLLADGQRCQPPAQRDAQSRDTWSIVAPRIPWLSRKIKEAAMHLSVLDALGFTARLRTRTTYRRGVTRSTHDHYVMDGAVRVKSVIGHHGAVGHHGAAVVRRPARSATIHHKLNINRLLDEFVSLGEMNRARQRISGKTTNNG